MKKNISKQSGFTLIELVIVIIILGILAAVAVPKFIDLQKDARISALNGMKGAIQSSDILYYSKASIEGKEKNSDATVEGVVTTYGIPHDAGNGGYGEFWSNQEKALSVSADDWDAPTEGINAITFANNLDSSGALISKCYLSYSVTVTTDEFLAEKTLTIEDSGC